MSPIYSRWRIMNSSITSQILCHDWPGVLGGHVRLVLCILAVGVAQLTSHWSKAADRAQPASESMLTWDLTSSHAVDQIPWPQGPGNEVSCLFEVKNRVKLQCTPELSIVCDVQRASAARNGKQLVFLAVSMKKETAAAARERALGIAKAFSISPENIEAWWADVQKNGNEAQSILAARRGAEATYDLAIHRSFNDAEPWFIRF